MESQNSLTEDVASYLEDRKIPIEIAARLGAGTWNGNLAFEYRKDGKLQYRKVRFVDETGAKSFGRDRKGAETCLFLEHTIETDADLSSPLVITEGELDALSVASCGLPNVVSVPDGAQLDAEGEGKIDPTSDWEIHYQIPAGEKVRSQDTLFGLPRRGETSALDLVCPVDSARVQRQPFRFA